MKQAAPSVVTELILFWSFRPPQVTSSLNYLVILFLHRDCRITRNLLKVTVYIAKLDQQDLSELEGGERLLFKLFSFIRSEVFFFKSLGFCFVLFCFYIPIKCIIIDWTAFWSFKEITYRCRERLQRDAGRELNVRERFFILTEI